ncbi:hypothetical protein CQW23_02892 [Capsicum baccatum]|uniref:Kinesin motor domain-containing protein n=1 Tax=Capsicum baccatum TaxID=33114 RepID=A0A2G2XSV7_CAPBA|nr:hypothetical protein CQW23_02892 [Capsicum baccatum]
MIINTNNILTKWGHQIDDQFLKIQCKNWPLENLGKQYCPDLTSLSEDRMLKIWPCWLFQIMDDPRVGFYVENIIEEYVSTYEDGLSSRKVGSTSINSKSSRSLIGFTCIIESWCKESSSMRFGSSKLSRMSLVDLAGFDKNIPDDAGKQFVKEGKYVKKSTSLLGFLCTLLSSLDLLAESLPVECTEEQSSLLASQRNKNWCPIPDILLNTSFFELDKQNF